MEQLEWVFAFITFITFKVSLLLQYPYYGSAFKAGREVHLIHSVQCA